MRIEPLTSAHVDAARSLLIASLRWDPSIAEVAEEKLFGPDPEGASLTIGAFDDAGALLGAAASASRFIKVLAVAEGVRRRGIGTALLGEIAAAAGPDAALRVYDHPGN